MIYFYVQKYSENSIKLRFYGRTFKIRRKEIPKLKPEDLLKLSLLLHAMTSRRNLRKSEESFTRAMNYIFRSGLKPQFGCNFVVESFITVVQSTKDHPTQIN